MPTLTLYHRPNCHLCDAMLAEIRTLYADSLEIQLVNVESDESLHERYWLKIPVLAAGEREICYGHLDRDSLESFLSSK